MVMDAGSNDAGHQSNRWNTTGRVSATRSSATLGAADQDGSGPRNGAAPDVTDPAKLAQDWITLWQSELSALATDREAQETWLSLTSLWTVTITNILSGLARFSDLTRHDGPGGRAGSTDAPRPAPVAAAPDARDDEIKRLARRVGELERRLAELERGGDRPLDGTGCSGCPSGR